MDEVVALTLVSDDADVAGAAAVGVHGVAFGVAVLSFVVTASELP